MAGRLCWASASGDNGTKILYMQLGAGQPWKPYTAFPGLAAKDYQIPGGSKGYATFQKLLKAGWEVVPSYMFHLTEPEVDCIEQPSECSTVAD